MYFYAVRKGRAPGVYTSWADARQQVSGFAGAIYRKFLTQADAEAFVAGRSQARTVTPLRRYPDAVQVWTDGSCFGNGQANPRAGIGVYFGQDDDPRNVAEPLVEHTPGIAVTNQQAELAAARRALEICSAEGACEVLLYSDSHYTKKCIENYIPVWRRNGWRKTNGELVKNQAILRPLAELLERLTVRVCYVPAHTGLRENEKADELARKGSEMALDSSAAI